MHVVMLTNILTPYRIPLFEAIARRIERLTVLVMARSHPNRDWIVGQEHSFALHVLPGVHFSGNGDKDPFHVNYSIIPVLIRLSPDVVVGGGFAPAHIGAFMYCKIAKRSYVCWGEFSLTDGAEYSRIRRLIRRTMISHCSGHIASSSTAQRAFAYYGADFASVLLSPMPIDIDRFQQPRAIPPPSTISSSEAGPVLLTAGRLVECKGYRQLLEIYSRLRLSFPHLTLVICGDGPLRGEIEQTICERGLTEVHVLGHRPSEELRDLMRDCDLFVFPSLSDTYGAVVPEAMAAGALVAASVYAAATEDLIVDGYTGFAFDPLAIDASINIITHALHLSKSVRTSVVAHAQELVQALSPDRTATAMVNYLRNLHST